MAVSRSFVVCSLALLGMTAVQAHHSYAMFDKSKSVVVEGSLAKLELINPHSFVWVYVKKAGKQGEYDLFGFEAASANQMKLFGWTKESPKTGAHVSIRYFPLRDGRPGGFLIWADLDDGKRLMTDKNAFGVDAELKRLERENAAAPATRQPEKGK